MGDLCNADIYQIYPITDNISEADGSEKGIIPCMCSANESRRYIVTSSLIGWAYTQNDPWEKG